MKSLLIKCNILIMLTILLYICVDDAGSVYAQVNTIQNFRIVDVSDSELKVTVDYTYNGEFGMNDVYIHATPEESGGVFDPRTVDYEEVPLKLNANSVILHITMRPNSRNFTSHSIRVCMSNLEEAILCEDFPYTKTWTSASTSDVSSSSDCIVSLNSPENNTTLSQRRNSDGKVETSWNFSWSECQGATRYHLYVIGPNALNPIVNINTLRATSYQERSTHYGITSLKRVDVEG